MLFCFRRMSRTNQLLFDKKRRRSSIQQDNGDQTEILYDNDEYKRRRCLEVDYHYHSYNKDYLYGGHQSGKRSIEEAFPSDISFAHDYPSKRRDIYTADALLTSNIQRSSPPVVEEIISSEVQDEKNQHYVDSFSSRGDFDPLKQKNNNNDASSSIIISGNSYSEKIHNKEPHQKDFPSYSQEVVLYNPCALLSPTLETARLLYNKEVVSYMQKNLCVRSNLIVPNLETKNSPIFIPFNRKENNWHNGKLMEATVEQQKEEMELD